MELDSSCTREESIVSTASSTSSASSSTSTTASMQERYEATMLLSGVGDAMGFFDGRWEFNHSGPEIHQQLSQLTKGEGINKLKLTLKNWPVSDDTVLHIATAEGLINHKKKPDEKPLLQWIACQYKLGMKDMGGRSPGGATISSMSSIDKDGIGWNERPYSRNAGGCGAAMRAACIGLKYYKPEQLNELIEVSVESGRTTHHNATGFLGSVAAALFTAYALQGVPTKEWGHRLISEVIPKVKEYIVSVGRAVNDCVNNMDYFINKWTKYLESRDIASSEGSGPVFPEKYDVKERDKYYKSLSYSGWAGSSGHDAPLIAYDALLFAKDSWETLMLHATLHGGDSDSTGTIAGAWYGALYGLQGVPECNYEEMEYNDRLRGLGKEMYELFYAGEQPQPQTTTTATATQ